MYKEFIAAMSKDFDLSDSRELKWFWAAWSTGLIMIAFITIKSSLVPLIEGLCAQI